ncbi:MAG TPA: pyridoxal phosphate-dependent aminotransferase [Candidatus Dormibacteraeota bacterium]|nr:pyridoxal phosphate-dependent aminotransferase [Candidatus Dormibacteraeota bacterium]
MKDSRVSARVRALKPSETLALGARARELRAQGHSVISFAAGEPDFDTPEDVREAGVQAIRAGHTRYTAVGGIPELRAAIAESLKRGNGLHYTPGQIVVSNGAKHSIWNAFLTLIEPGDQVLCPVPYWVTFPELVRLVGGEPVFVHPKPGSIKIGPEELERDITQRSKLLVLNSPNNPSGAVYTKEELEALGKVIRKHGLYVLSDEIYEQLVFGNARHVSIASLHPELQDRTILIGGVSKTWAMTGWRIGFAAAPADLAEGMERLQGQSTSNAAAVSQFAALRAFTGPRESVNSMRECFARRRDRIVERLSAMPGIRLVPPEGAFYAFPDMSERIRGARNGVKDSVGLSNYLIDEARIVCVPGSAFGMEGHLRLSYAIADQDIEEGLNRFEAALDRM